jgi:hypothetical protein
MKWLVLLVTLIAVFSLTATSAWAVRNGNAKWVFNAVPHVKGATCPSTEPTDCGSFSYDQLPTPAGYDLYIVLVDIGQDVGSCRYGICCEPKTGAEVYLSAWTKCSPGEYPTPGPTPPAWFSCGAGNLQTWGLLQNAADGPHITLGFIYIYPYVNYQISTCADPRVDFAEVCDGTAPDPICSTFTEASRFGTVGFGMAGYNPCGISSTTETTWGQIKSLYQ